MSDFYTNVRDDTVIPLIREFGQTVTRTRDGSAGTIVKEFIPVEGRYQYRDTASGTITHTPPASSISTATGNAVVTEFEDRLIDESLVKQGDKLLITIDLGLPQTGDIYTVQGIDYNYVTHETISPGGTDVLYKIQIRV